METISEEQVLHNELSFEINTELIHLMKRIIEIQRANEILQQRISDAIEYIKGNYNEYGEGSWSYRTINADNVLDILRGGEDNR